MFETDLALKRDTVPMLRFRLVSQPLKPLQTKIIGVNFGDRRIFTAAYYYLSTELNSVFGSVLLGTCLKHN